MTATAQRWHLALFCLCALALLLGALGFSSGAPDASPSTHSLLAPTSSRQPAPSSVAAGLRVATRRFLAAFFRYEAGEADRSAVRRALRATATPAFAAELLSEPPRRPAIPLPPARLQRLMITLIPTTPARALASSEARRGKRSEQLSVLFDLRQGAWLARGLRE